MAKENRPNPRTAGLPRIEQWLYVRRLYGLSHAEIQMAVDLSLGPHHLVIYEKRRVKKHGPRSGSSSRAATGTGSEKS